MGDSWTEFGTKGSNLYSLFSVILSILFFSCLFTDKKLNPEILNNLLTATQSVSGWAGTGTRGLNPRPLITTPFRPRYTIPHREKGTSQGIKAIRSRQQADMSRACRSQTAPPPREPGHQSPHCCCLWPVLSQHTQAKVTWSRSQDWGS